jgi:peptidoglycan L-alanyl-D-glutamate endopeptidase CwlK
MIDSGFRLGKRSRESLQGVDSDLVLLVGRAILLTKVDFAVTEGLRTAERQRSLVDSGASKTMNSRHLTGNAIDVAAWVGGEIRWDWPLYHTIHEGFLLASEETGIAFEWGGLWSSFPDGPHYQLPR